MYVCLISIQFPLLLNAHKMKTNLPSSAGKAVFVFKTYYLKNNFWNSIIWGGLIHGFAGICFYNVLWWESSASLDSRLAYTLLNVIWGFTNSVFLMVVVIPFIYLKLLNRSNLYVIDHIILTIVLVLVEAIRFYYNNSHIYNFGISFWESLKYVVSFSSVLVVFNFLVILSTKKETPPAPRTPAQVVIGKESKDALNIFDDQLLVVEAAGNYSDVYWLNQVGVLQKSLLPATLGSIEIELMQFPQFYRCHKSFIINLAQVDKFYGNTRETYIEIKQYAAKVPVARDKIRKLKAMLATTDFGSNAIALV